MSIIYEPKGKAKEYCELAINLYKGCEHGCKYCYVPAIFYKSPDEFHNEISVRRNLISELQKEIRRYAGMEILFSFTSDPYQSISAHTGITREVIEILQEHDCIVNILTKAGIKSIVDFDLLASKKSKYGATLTFINDNDSLEWEKGSALPESRFKALELAHNQGIETWASLEPVIDPEQSLKIIEITNPYIDIYKIGKWNHDIRAKKIDWVKFRESAIELCERYGKNYYIKKDLAEAI